MKQRRIKDQIEVLLAIQNVRAELKRAKTKTEGYEILMRLSTLYSVLNVEQLIRLAEFVDKRDYKEAA